MPTGRKGSGEGRAPPSPLLQFTLTGVSSRDLVRTKLAQREAEVKELLRQVERLEKEKTEARLQIEKAEKEKEIARVEGEKLRKDIAELNLKFSGYPIGCDNVPYQC